MSSFAQERTVMSLTSQSFALCQKLAHIEDESSLYKALDEIVCEVAKNCEVDAAVLVMRKPHQPDFSSYLHDLHSFGLTNDERKQLSFFLAQAVVPEVIQRMKPIMRNDVRLNLLRDQAQGQRSKMMSMLAAPMVMRRELVGMLVLFRSEIAAFCDDDGDFFQSVASLIAEEVENSGAYLRIAKDSATGFYSRRVFFEALAQEIARARRYQEPLSAVVLELDTTLLHQRGNERTIEQFLKRFSQRITSETRQSDIIARISDNTFLLLQPMTGGQSSLEVANRICGHFKQHPIVVNDSPVPMRIFGGVSSLSLSDDDGSAMLIRADNALSLAKKAGDSDVGIQIGS